MESQPLDLGPSQMQSTADPAESLTKTLSLLEAKNDTSRFVGLAILKSILDNKAALQKDPEVIARCWAAIPVKFLDRLLRAEASEKKSKEEAKSMVELAVAVLHAFIVLLPPESLDDTKLSGRSGGLIAALDQSSSDATNQILEILLTLASTQNGANALLMVEDWSPLVEIAPQQQLALEIVKYTLLTTNRQSSETAKVRKKLNSTVPALVVVFRDASDVNSLLDFMNEVLTSLSIEVLPVSPTWLRTVTNLMHKASLSRHQGVALQTRRAVVHLASSLLHLYPSEYPNILFNGPDRQTISPDSNPPSYLFIKLLLIDIRSSIPSLQETLNSPSYPSDSTRLASSYDILSAFISFLVQSLDNEDSDSETPHNANTNPSPSPLHLSPSLLLRLRADISELLSLTIEHLRDRYDASIGGAPGLHPSARPSPQTSTNLPLAISWDSASSTIAQDPLTLSQIRTLALWLREDDNDSLRKEAASITDVMLFLYGTDGELEFRSPVLIALEGVTTTPEGVEAFLSAEGWEVLVQDLRGILASSKDAGRGIEIVRVLLGVAESDVVGPAKEEWMAVVGMAAAVFRTGEGGNMDLGIAVAQLAVEVLIKAPRGLAKRHAGPAKQILGFARASLKAEGKGCEGETRDGLEDIVQGLESLNVRI